jgi:hypothetical protein
MMEPPQPSADYLLTSADPLLGNDAMWKWTYSIWHQFFASFVPFLLYTKFVNDWLHVVDHVRANPSDVPKRNIKVKLLLNGSKSTTIPHQFSHLMVHLHWNHHKFNFVEKIPLILLIGRKSWKFFMGKCGISPGRLKLQCEIPPGRVKQCFPWRIFSCLLLGLAIFLAVFMARTSQSLYLVLSATDK